MKGKTPKLFGVVMALVLALSLAVAAVPAAPASADGDLESWWTKITIPEYGEDGDYVLLDTHWVGPIAVSPDGDSIFAGAYPGSPTLYRSDDDGYTWRELEVFGDEIQDIAVSPGYDDDETVVVATLDEVFISFDRGRTFTLLGSVSGGTFNDTSEGENPSLIMSMDAALDDEDRLSIVVGTYDFGSDGGDVHLLEYPVMTWQELDASLGGMEVDDVLDVRFSPNYATDSQILAMVNGYYVLDGGNVTALINKFGDEIWNDYIGAAVFRDMYGESDTSFRADIGFGDDYIAAPLAGSLFVGIWGDNDHPPLYDDSTALGDVWRVDFMPTPASSTATDLNVRGRIAGITPTDTDVCSIAVDGNTADATIVVGTEGYDVLGVTPAQMPVYVSSDGGESYTAAYKPPSGVGYFYVEFGPDGAYYAGSAGPEAAFSVGIEGYAGTAWNQRGLINTDIYYITDIRPSPGYATDETLFMVTVYDGGWFTTSLWKTTDGGDEWERILTGSDMGYGLLGIDFFFLVETPDTFPSDPSVKVAQWGGSAIWGSSDAGGLFMSKVTAREDITAWHVVSGTELWVADVNTDPQIWHSTDSGVIWTAPDDSEIDAPIIDIEIAPGGSDILAGSVSGDVFISTDDGLTFEQLGGNIGDGDIVVVAFDIDYDTNNIIYAGAFDGDDDIYRWEVGDSTSWETILDEGLAITKLWSADDGTLYASHTGGACVARSVNPTAVEPEFEDMDDPDGGSTDWRLEVVSGSNIVFVVGWDYDDDEPAIWVFEDTISGPVTLVAPTDGATAAGYIMEAGYWYGNARVMLSWEQLEGADEYEVVVALDEDFGTVLDPDVIGLPEDGMTEGTVVDAYFALGTTFYWRVRVYWPLYSEWSETWSFTTPLGPGAARPILESPSAGQEGVGLKPTLEWTGLIDATTYELEIAEDCDWNNVVEITTTATIYVVVTDLDYGTTYCWKVRALSETTESPWSDVGTFYTMAEPIPEEAPVTPLWVWVVIGLGAVLAVAVIVLIMRTRKPV